MANTIDDLGLSPAERVIVKRLFGAGRSHPWSDALTDEIMDWIDVIVFNYLVARRDRRIIESYIPQFQELLDKVILERFESLRSAQENVHENPPYHTADRWPRAEFSVAKTVVEWAFGNPTT